MGWSIDFPMLHPCNAYWFYSFILLTFLSEFRIQFFSLVRIMLPIQKCLAQISPYTMFIFIEGTIKFCNCQKQFWQMLLCPNEVSDWNFRKMIKTRISRVFLIASKLIKEVELRFHLITLCLKIIWALRIPELAQYEKYHTLHTCETLTLALRLFLSFYDPSISASSFCVAKNEMRR